MIYVHTFSFSVSRKDGWDKIIVSEIMDKMDLGSLSINGSYDEDDIFVYCELTVHTTDENTEIYDFIETHGLIKKLECNTQEFNPFGETDETNTSKTLPG